MKRITIAMIALVGFASATVAQSAAGGPPPGCGPRGQQVRNNGVCDGTGPSQTRGLGRMQGQRQRQGQGLASRQNFTPLSKEESHELLGMREEEKLARDVYIAMYEQWELPIFKNISGAEQRHMDALARMLDRYDLEDPVENNTPGILTNSVFASLYGELVENGSDSLLDALKIGALIEEMDIVDLREALDVTTHRDLKRVYENLMRASRNHLRAFARQINVAGGSYAAEYLTQEEFDKIANSLWERGHSRKIGQGQGKGVGQGQGFAQRQGRGKFNDQGMGNGKGQRRGSAQSQRRGMSKGQVKSNGVGQGRGFAQRQGRGMFKGQGQCQCPNADECDRASRGRGRGQGTGQGRAQQGRR